MIKGSVAKVIEQLQAVAAQPGSDTGRVDPRILLDRRAVIRDEAVDAIWTIASRRRRQSSFTLLALYAGLSDPSALVRDRSVTALGELGSPRDVSRIARLSTDEEWIVRASVAGSLGSWITKGSFSCLRDLLRGDPICDVRRYAAISLSGFSRYGAEALLLTALRDEKEPLCQASYAIALTLLGNVDQISLLSRLLSEVGEYDRNLITTWIREEFDRLRPELAGSIRAELPVF